MYNWMLSEVKRVGDLIAKSWDEKENAKEKKRISTCPACVVYVAMMS